MRQRGHPRRRHSRFSLSAVRWHRARTNADSDETAADTRLGTGLKPGHSDGDGIGDGIANGNDPNALDSGGRIAKCGGDCEHETTPTLAGYANELNSYGDGCNDDEETGPSGLKLNGILLSTTNWGFYAVPVPPLFSSSTPKNDFRTPGMVSAASAQTVFAYFKNNANLGTVLYNQDLNQNNVMDGFEYDRSTIVGPNAAGPPGGPDGVIGVTDAQKSFAEYRANLVCTAGYNMGDSSWYHGDTP